MRNRAAGKGAIAAACLMAGLSFLGVPSAHAQIEDLEQVEPGAGEWQAQYTLVRSGGDGHAFELARGLSDLLIVGGEVDLDGREFDSAAAKLLLRFSDPEKGAAGLSMEFSAGVDRDGQLDVLEARAIVDRRRPRWWVMANIALRNAGDRGARGTGIAYAMSALRSVGKNVWLGGEVSGRLARIAGTASGAPAPQHYIGPSSSFAIAGTPVEIGAAWLWRFAGRGSPSGPRIFAQVSF